MRACRVFSSRALALVALFLVSAAPPVESVVCANDSALAATLMIPYVELDVTDCSAPPAANTVVNVTNAVSAPTLVHVTLWSDMAVPVLDFDIYLAGFDSQTLDFHDMICNGNLPTTGSAVSAHSAFSDPPVAHPSCNNTATLGNPPAYLNPAINSVFREHIKAWMRGLQSPTIGDCAGFPHGDAIARGYLTMDVATDCSLLFPSEEAYYTNGIIGFENRLMGWFALLDGAGRVDTYTAVHIEAAPGTFQAGDVTFYGRYVPAASPAADMREPLPSTWAAQYSSNAAGAVPLLAWREVDQGSSGFACTTLPPWHPLPLSMTTGGDPFISFGPTGAATPIGTTMGLASQRVGVGSGLTATGWIYANLQHGQTGVAPGQAWVSVDRATGSPALEAIALDSSCNRANLSVTRPGTTTSNPPNWVVPVELMDLTIQ